jgi:hypothetical protein
MTRFAKNLLLTGLVLGTTLAAVAEVKACHGRSRRSYSYRPQPTYYCPSQAYVPSQPSVQPQRPPQQQLGAVAPVQQSGANPQISIRIRQPNSSAAPQNVTATKGNVAPTAMASNAAASALQALSGGVSQPQQQVATPSQPEAGTANPLGATQPQMSGHVGSWTARLSNGAQVRLDLQAEGRFNWVATNKSGQTSTFQGSYTFGNGSLTLVRSSDNQKLSGTVTLAGNQSFIFKLSGAKDNGLSFART